MKNVYPNNINKILSILNGVFTTFMLITLYFAITSPNLTLGDTVSKQTIGESTTWVTVLFVLMIASVTIGTAVIPNFRAYFRWVFIKNGLVTGTGALLLSFLMQLIVILNTHPAIGFDPGAIHDALTNTTSADLISYYSYNTNNLPLLLLQHLISMITNTSSWLMFDLINLLLLAITTLINILTVMIIDRNSIKAALYLHAFWLSVFPMVLVPYSDVFVLPLVSATLFLYALTCKWPKYPMIIFTGVGIGILVSCTYFIKPSAIIPLVAIIIIEVITFKTVNTMKKLLLLVAIFVALGVTYTGLHNVVTQQTYIRIQKNRTLPAIHFISMGVSGDGGYNAADALAMAKMRSQNDMRHYSWIKFKNRIGSKGFVGYLRFLVHKHNKNTADGTFGWLIEGHFMNAQPSGRGLQRTIQEFLYPTGIHLADFRYIAQVWWISFLGIIFLGWRQKGKYFSVLRLSIVGAFCYLLIFEGGRSRYLIQFLPSFLLLASLLFRPTVALINEKSAWIYDEKIKE